MESGTSGIHASGSQDSLLSVLLACSGFLAVSPPLTPAQLSLLPDSLSKLLFPQFLLVIFLPCFYKTLDGRTEISRARFSERDVSVGEVLGREAGKGAGFLSRRAAKFGTEIR